MHVSLRVRAASSLAAVAIPLVAAPAAALDDTTTQTAEAQPPPPVAATTGHEATVPSFSLAFERVGGIGYARAAGNKDGDGNLSLVAFGIGGVTPNPFAVPRLAGDFILGSGLTLGGAIGFTRLSADASNGNKSADLGSVFLYALTPRVGYRIPLTEKVDFTPRAGVTFAGASYSPPSGNNSGASASVFAVALGADAPFAFRLTKSFNILAGVAVDYTLAATATTESTSTTTSSGPGGGSGQTSTQTSDVKGSLFSLQGWLGIGGYL